MAKVEFSTNAAEVAKQMRQLPFAMALALTRTAQSIQKAEQEQLERRFHLNRPDFMKKGIRIEKATKQHLEATVKDVHAFMVIQDTGGAKTPKAGSHVAIPESVRTNKRGVVTRSNYPREILKRKRVFVAKINGTYGIWQRTTKKRLPIILLWALKPSVNIPARYDFHEVGQRAADQAFGAAFDAAFAMAMRTAR